MTEAVKRAVSMNAWLNDHWYLLPSLIVVSIGIGGLAGSSSADVSQGHMEDNCSHLEHHE